MHLMVFSRLEGLFQDLWVRPLYFSVLNIIILCISLNILKGVHGWTELCFAVRRIARCITAVLLGHGLTGGIG